MAAVGGALDRFPPPLRRALACPRCREGLELDDERLVCASGHAYEVRNGVPRLVEQGWSGEDAALAAETSRVFGDQWVTLGEHAGVARDDLELHLPSAWDTSVFAGAVLDVGCGMGRYTRLVSQLGADAVGVDVSRAVDKAAELWPDVPFVQGDVAAPPFHPQSFDLVYSFGVLHHLPDPLRGLSECFGLIRTGGRLLVWVYSDHAGVLRRGRRIARRFVHGRPALVRPLALAAAAALRASLPVARAVGRSEKLAFYRGKDFGQLYTDCHDALAAPREVYLSADDCRRWLETLPTETSGWERRRDGSGWLLWAMRT